MEKKLANVNKYVLICCFVILVADLLAVPSIPLRFRRMSPEGGLYHNGIQSIAQDADGYIWFNTIDELFKFDGYNFTRFQNINNGEKLIRDPQFNYLLSDSKQRLWIATNRGLFFYDIASGTFKLEIEPDEEIIRICEDHSGNLWLLSSTKIGIYDPIKGIFKAIFKGLDSSVLLSTCYADLNNLWVGTKNGEVYKFDNTTKSFLFFTKLIKPAIIQDIVSTANDVYVLAGEQGLYHFGKNGVFIRSYTFFLENADIKGNNLGRTLHIDANKTLWIGTHRGLYLLNTINGSYSHYKSNVNDEFSLPNNSIWTISEDRLGGIWIGTYSGGLGYVNFKDHRFQHIMHTDNISMNNNFISAFIEDYKGNYWIGTEGAGLDYYDRATGTFTNYKHTFEKNSLSYDNVKALVMDKNSNLWIGTYNGGLDFFDVINKRFVNYKHVPSNIKSLSSNIIYSLQIESDSGLWIGTHNRGIDFFNFRTKEFAHYSALANENNALGLHYVNGLHRGSGDYLWIASRHGLNMLNVKSKVYKHYFFNISDTINFGSNEIFSVYEDKSRTIWIGTKGYGLYSFNPKTEKFKHHSVDSVLIASAIYGILDNNQGDLWLSSNDGLFKYEVAKGLFHRFDKSDGLQGNLFYPNAFLKSRNGELIFGGTNGFTVFQPDSIQKNRILPRTIITGFLINNKRIFVLPDKNGDLKKIEHLDKVVLDYTQTVFSFEFSAINYLMPEKNKFAYQLQGYDNRWFNTTAGMRFVSYSNLPSGNYVFRVKASNNDGEWSNEVKSIKISILPPPWKTWWAYLIYLFLVSGIILVLMRIYKIKRKYQTQIYLEKLGKEKLSDLNRMKIQFFTNISHEFKTPLTLIISPLKEMMKTAPLDGKFKKDIDLVHRNVIRLQNLINQLMDFRALESNRLKILNRNGDIFMFFNELKELFVPLMTEHHIHFAFETNLASVPASFDHDKFEKIFYNLLSNAVKFTPAEGQVILSLNILHESMLLKNQLREESSNRILKVQVINTGSQIPASQLQYIFDNYFNIERHDSVVQRGSGVGLAFTKELLDLLNGEITVTSTEIETCFDIRIPFVNMKTTEGNGDGIAISNDYRFNYSQDLVTLLGVEKKETSFIVENTLLPTILIVEDNTDLQEHLFDSFKNDYQVFIGSNGEEGLKLAKDKKPVLIISDVFMPKMSGTELCRQLKSDIVTSHIPVVLLSAFNSQEQKNHGMETGADVYIEKPFDLDYLKMQVKNLILSRDAIRRAFSKKVTPEPEQIFTTPMDEQFIKKAMSVLETHMDNSEFNVETFVKEMGIGRTFLYQKIKALTDLSANDFIQNIRLKRAAQLLKDTDLSISEIAYKVGFSEPKYFSTCFKKHFSISPSVYVANNKQLIQQGDVPRYPN